MTLALLCSGQGRQGPGMFDAIGDGAPARAIMDVAERMLGCDLADLRGDALQANRTAQILCVARSLAAAASLDLPASLMVAGYSVGEMAAWGIAGCWSAEETLRLTGGRAELMDAASSKDDGLGFVRGLERVQVDALVRAHDCAIAIVNPGQLFVIGGDRGDVARCCAAALAQGASHARPIGVNVASHTARLAAAVAPFDALLSSAATARPVAGRTLLSASDGRVVTGARALAGLSAQLATCIDWAMTLEALVERGADRMLELGPGSALAEMARGAYPHLDIRALDDFQTMAGASRWIGRA